ncbi:voltage-dependent anion-selective channel [Anaeramoeba flamelloides]|uniref:Voltage-dependent anion-selective channel n=1 Tax=Anaeramoeba flamelloides TaxID=1746091 RepID=A0ABQ8YI22_9EUKA|nr:voltage-dependent anion-selective channel [Anaeramoeba flamelloides]
MWNSWKVTQFKALGSQIKQVLDGYQTDHIIAFRSSAINDFVYSAHNKIQKAEEGWILSSHFAASYKVNKWLKVTPAISTPSSFYLNFHFDPYDDNSFQFGLIGKNSVDKRPIEGIEATAWGSFKHRFFTLNGITDFKSKAVSFSGTTGYNNLSLGVSGKIELEQLAAGQCHKGNRRANNDDFQKVVPFIEIKAVYQPHQDLVFSGSLINLNKAISLSSYYKASPSLSLAFMIKRDLTNEKNQKFHSAFGISKKINDRISIKSKLSDFRYNQIAIKYSSDNSFSISVSAFADLANLSNLSHYKVGISVGWDLSNKSGYNSKKNRKLLPLLSCFTRK